MVEKRCSGELVDAIGNDFSFTCEGSIERNSEDLTGDGVGRSHKGNSVGLDVCGFSHGLTVG